MDTELKTKWVKALRSGRYRQTRAILADGNGGYCCLGVLCKVAGLKIRPDGNGVLGHGYNGDATYSSYEPIFDLVGGYENSHPLSMRNDGSGKFEKHSFSEIAEYIEKNL